MKQGRNITGNTEEIIWHLYMIRLENGHLYTGITTDVERRLSEHQTGKGAKYLRGKGTLLLVFSAVVGSRSSALKMEAKIKKLPKQEKEKIVRMGICPAAN